MGLGSLSNALSGLSIAQRQIDVISNNVANAGTPGFTRKTLPQSAQAVDGIGAGVRAGIVGRNVDLDLTRTLFTQISTVSYSQVQEGYLNRVSQFHGPPDAEISVSAELSALSDSFAVLSDDPLNPFALSATVDQAVDLSHKINDFSALITTLRNDAQNEITDSVRQVNNLLSQIADLNEQVRTGNNVGRSTAASEDARDIAIQELSELIEISSFVRGDGVMVVQTNRGAQLAGTSAEELFFDPAVLSPDIFYPDSAAGIYINDPDTDRTAFEISAFPIGGKIGGLLELRDETFPKQMAQVDELAHKLALRFEAQGLRLFTDETGAVPLDTPPDLTTDPETPVPYVGFAASMRVNSSILNDNTILQRGTTASAADIDSGSNEVISRIIDFALGDVNYQEAIGTIDLRTSLNATPNNTLQNFLGIQSENTVSGTRNLTEFLDPATFIAATNSEIGVTNSTFRITLEESELSYGPVNIDIDLTAVADGAGNFAQDLIDHINGVVIPALPPADAADYVRLEGQFSISNDGQLSIDTIGDITIDNTNPANPLTNTGLSLLGLSASTTEAEDPYFDIGVGNNDYTRITIEPSDDETSLLAKLQDVPGLAVQINATTGQLEIRPGNDITNPEFGGSIKLISGPFLSDTAGADTVFGAGTIPDDINLISSLFGSFNAGPPATDSAAIVSVGYQSQISSTDTQTLAFREDFLGPGGGISTNIIGSTSILDFAQKLVNENTQELISLQDRIEDDDTFRDLLSDQLLNESGVNLDEELANLIVVQTAFAASARVVNVVDELFQELLNAIR